MHTLRKSLGQHFLKDENICRKILASLQQQPFNNLLEIGPGGGALTKYLLQIPGINFKAVEIDEEKIDFLLKTYPGVNDKLIHANVLEMDLPFPEKFTVVGNFPYNISTQILFKVMEWKDNIECVIGMFQKEVAQRLAAGEGNKVYGVTSILVQAFFSVNLLFDVPPQCFQPPPRVNSSVIRLLPRAGAIPMRSEADLFQLVKAAFNQRRKTLRNAVKHLFDPAILMNAGFDRRAEQLKVEEFGQLTFEMK